MEIQNMRTQRNLSQNTINRAKVKLFGAVMSKGNEKCLKQ